MLRAVQTPAPDVTELVLRWSGGDKTALEPWRITETAA